MLLHDHESPSTVSAPHFRGVPSHDEVLSWVRSYIEQHLGDPTLSIEQIARAHYMSERSLQRLFQLHGTTVTRFIRETRLERCREQLCDPAWAREPIYRIGVRWGLHDPAHLSNLFRGAYGCAPREFRKMHLSDPQQEAFRVERS